MDYPLCSILYINISSVINCNSCCTVTESHNCTNILRLYMNFNVIIVMKAAAVKRKSQV